VAASVIVGFLVWSSRQEVSPMAPLKEATEKLSMIDAEQAELADWLTTSLDATADASDPGVDRLLSIGRWDGLNSVYQAPREEEVSQ
jgi:hypothetical protein